MCRRLLVLMFVLIAGIPVTAQSHALDARSVDRFARLALSCVQKEYPNKIAHVLESDEDVKPPRELTPIFFGCFDWHSAVHGHWLLVRLCRLYPDAPFVPDARRMLSAAFTKNKATQELAYFRGPGRASFERPYGLAWFLQLTAELRTFDDAGAKEWAVALEPLEREIVTRLMAWFPKLSHPIRTGEHSQTAFAMGLMLDWARTAKHAEFEAMLLARSKDFYEKDRGCNMGFEPSGQDFLSPCLAEADLMRRVLGKTAFAAWLGGFLPTLPLDGSEFLSPAVVTDKADGKLAHLDGLNLARAWMLEGMASGLPDDDPRRVALLRGAEAHRISGLAAVTGEHYEGGHWLGSFATYLVTRRGLPQD